MIYRHAALAASLFLVVGCGSSNDVHTFADGTTAPVSATAPANLYVQGPPVSGQVTVVNTSGETLATATAVAGVATLTLPEAAFGEVRAQATSPLVVNFTVDDGTHLEAGDGPATFKAEVPHPVDGDVVGIDAVSSLIAVYHESHPRISFDQAAAEVFEYLALPPETDPEHLFTDTDFESSLFYSQAQSAGGVDALLSQVAGEIDAPGNAAPGRFLQTNLSSPVNLNGIATGLAKSALDYSLDAIQGEIKGQVLGWLQGLVGIKEGPSISDVLDAIDGIRQDIAKLSGQISTQGRIQAYITKDSVLVPARASANTDTATLTGWASPTNLTPPTEAQISAKMDEIRQRYNSTLATAAALELPDVGSTGALEPGLSGLYLNGAVPRIYSAVSKDRATYHLRRSLDFQQLVLNLQVEALHYARPSLLLDAEAAIDTYFASFKLQLQQYPLAFDEDNILLDRETHLLWTRRPLMVNDARQIPGLVAGYTLGDAPAGAWRLPSTAELGSLVSATGGTGIDQHTEIGLKREGFLPVNGATTIGDWRIGQFDWLVLSSDFQADGVSARGQMIHVSNFRQSGNQLVDYDRHSGVSTPHKVAFYLVRNDPQVESITVTERSRSATSVSYTATARLSDGSDRNVTEVVKWSAQTGTGADVTHDVARISNVPGTDGVLTLRVSQSLPITVVATYNSVEGRLQAPSLTFAAPAITGVLLSPLRYHVPVDGYTANRFEIAFSARIARANGALSDAGGQVTWQSSDPSAATVSASGLVTATRPSAQKVVKITATVGSVSQTSRLVLEP